MNNLKLLLLSVFTFICSSCFSQTISLAESGKSKYQIVVLSDASGGEEKAAIEFQKYFNSLSGLTLPIQKRKNFKSDDFSILMGDISQFPNGPKLQDGGVFIKTEESNLIIAGVGKRGILNAVSTFLENYLEVRYFALDEIVVPKKTNVLIPAIDYHYSPPFNFRSYYSLENLDRDYANFQKQTYFFEDRLYPAHSLAWLLPASKYFLTNPDFFALIDGKRNPSQICFSSKGALQELIKILQLEIAAAPENKVWSVSALDSPYICHCNLCENTYKKGSGFPETLMPFVNRIAQVFPDKTISTLAYNQSILPSELVKPEKNVEIMFCFTNIDRRYSINSPKNTDAAKYISAFQKWKSQTNNLFIWDYPVNYFHSLFPFPNIHTLQDNIKYYRHLGVQKVFLNGIGPQKGEFSELKSYLASQLLWNPDANFEVLLDSFLKNYYGNGWQKVKEYIFTVEAESKKSNLPIREYDNPILFKAGFLSTTNITNYRKILNLALSQVTQNDKYYNRILKELLSVEYADLEIKSSINTNKNTFNKELKNFKKEAQNINIKNLRNGEFTIDEFSIQKEKK